MSKYELVMCIVNTGFSETVMSAAKEVGARGGTVLHARGTANKEAEEFFHITVQPDKEIVMIIVPAEIKDDVLHAIYRYAGLKTAGQGIAFSVPVGNAVGLAPSSPEQAEAEKDEQSDKKTDGQSTEGEKEEEKEPK